ncbi:MAG: amidohydrolase family protein [Tissierellia bacterium]|nr:amidohydrolase family protein [Tissierellia bacterium]
MADSLPQETIDYYVERIQSIIEDQKTLTKNLYDKGARILLGTDANNPFVVPGFSVHDELHNLVDAGLTPYEAIKAGTYDAAEFLNILEEAGSVEENKNADLILLDGNPLEDISNMRNIEGVMVRGQWISKSEIENMLKSRIEKQGGEK